MKEQKEQTLDEKIGLWITAVGLCAIMGAVGAKIGLEMSKPIVTPFTKKDGTRATFFNSSLEVLRPYIETYNADSTVKEVFSVENDDSLFYMDSTGTQYKFASQDSLPKFLAEKKDEFIPIINKYAGGSY